MCGDAVYRVSRLGIAFAKSWWAPLRLPRSLWLMTAPPLEAAQVCLVSLRSTSWCDIALASRRRFASSRGLWSLSGRRPGRVPLPLSSSRRAKRWFVSRKRCARLSHRLPRTDLGRFSPGAGRFYLRSHGCSASDGSARVADRGPALHPATCDQASAVLAGELLTRAARTGPLRISNGRSCRSSSTSSAGPVRPPSPRPSLCVWPPTHWPPPGPPTRRLSQPEALAR